MTITRLYRSPGLSTVDVRKAVAAARAAGIEVTDIATEHCFYVASDEPLDGDRLTTLRWLLAETFEPAGFGETSFLSAAGCEIVEVGPRMSFSTAWSTNAVAVCHACGLEEISRIERSRRFALPALTDAQRAAFSAAVHDRMTECLYLDPLTDFAVGVEPRPVTEVPVMEQGRAALEAINAELGLAFDDWDLDYYTALFRKMGRNPTDVECFDIAQSNSEHSRHWFFKGRLVLDGEEQPQHLISMIQGPLKANPNNSVIAFNDNSSSIRGVKTRAVVPTRPGAPSPLAPAEIDQDVIFTAETHNFPSGVAPFPGAETGTGGRIRDVHATGRGSDYTAGTAAYCVGNLQIPGYEQPWENPDFAYPDNLASPLEIEIEASNGASDYGNKFGEPVVQGFTRSFGLRLPSGERREWIKPIMFSGGIGRMDHRHVTKGTPEVGMWVVKLGGPAYRIGMGGGAASSMVQGENAAELDFNAVQRGDAEMEQKVNRVIRACCELGHRNPIISIHDQGAGGNCNVLKEIVEPAGARIEIRAFPVGDETLSVLEIWGAEYQENDALLLAPEHRELFESLCAREKVPVAFVGRVTGDGRVVVHDERNAATPVDLELEQVLGDMPQKSFTFDRARPTLDPLSLPEDLTVREALERVLRLLSVGSKRFLTTKVDRAVTGLIARQPCAGPLQLTVADVAVVAASHLGTAGGATAIGEQPVKGLLDPSAMARLSVGEALTNLVWARVTGLGDVRCSANWMWAAKLPGEGAALHDAAEAMCDVMTELGIAVDGGKDSLSMAALTPDGETVKTPGALVVSAYCTCPDIAATVTPDLELPGSGRLLFVDLGGSRDRLGGSALAQVFGQVGDASPDVDDAALLGRAFNAVQTLLANHLVSAGHDRSDGGLITTLLEMAFAGDCGIEIALGATDDSLAALFAEELGLVLEVDEGDLDTALRVFADFEVPCAEIGRTTAGSRVRVCVGSDEVLDEDMRALRDLWEATSFQLDRLQADPGLVAEEEAGLTHRRTPSWGLGFEPAPTPPAIMTRPEKIPVAILREEGSNGDREMAAAFLAAGFEPWDVTMSDLLAGRIGLTRFRGLAAVGGFSYADVLDSAKGWAGAIRFNDELRRQFVDFADRPDTFSLGVCNGCQLLALLGWVPWRGLDDTAQPRFVRNASGRFESRFVSVKIQPSPAIMLDAMAGSTMGIWVQHGEGRALFPDRSVLDRTLADGLAPIRFADDEGRITESYPFNPNGSPEGIAALCSPDGRHLAMMPHPERCFEKWQWGWMPRQWRQDLEASPWLKLFQNAREWCEGTR
ncbi:MAG: phosphoribosylformylglycinamidine synthase [Thermoanaerobaculales bacterium]|nr:phosphoribosylformylglycinamidine synthase [Thermoanaerobaculales bacterium]